MSNFSKHLGMVSSKVKAYPIDDKPGWVLLKSDDGTNALTVDNLASAGLAYGQYYMLVSSYSIELLS